MVCVASLSSVSGAVAKLLRIQSIFICALCQLQMGVPIVAPFAEVGDVLDEPWDHKWWLIIRSAGNPNAVHKGCLHREILQENILNARLYPVCGNCTAQNGQHGRAAIATMPFSADGSFVSVVIRPNLYRSRLLEMAEQAWAYISPRTCPSEETK